MKKLWKFLLDNSLLLVIGAVVALIWANCGEAAQHFYHHILEAHFDFMDNTIFGSDAINEETKQKIINTTDGGFFLQEGAVLKHFDIHYLINDFLMAFFFMAAGKEVFEATFPGGALHNPKQAATPLIATAGGVLGPIGVFCLIVLLFSSISGFGPHEVDGNTLGAAFQAKDGSWHSLYDGWAVPTATDIAFSAMIARIIFGGRHPAVPFLLLLAIADDAVGLVIIAIVFGAGFGLNTAIGLGVVVALMLFGYFVLNKKLHCNSWVPYFLLMLISWFCFGYAGIHTSLGFIPIVFCMPHAEKDEGVHSDDERGKEDALNKIQSVFYVPTEIILGLFGWASAGVALTTIGFPTAAVAFALIIGKMVGIFLFGGASGKILGLPEGMSYKDLLVLGSAAGIGFTVALFVAGEAFPDGDVKDAAKLGALLSLGSMVVAFILSKICKTERRA